MKKLFRNIHLWLSVPFGIIITLTCFSGAMLIFEKEVTHWLRPELYKVLDAETETLPLGQLVSTVAAALPSDVNVTGITVYADPDRTWQVSLSKPRRSAVYVNPYTGEVSGRYERMPFFAAMSGLHRWLLDSRPADDGMFWGKMIVGVSTLLFVVVLVSGIIIWWPRTKKALKNSLKITAQHGLRRFWHDLHVAGGMYALLLLLVMALTGLTWSFSWYRTGFYKVFGVEMKPSMGHGNAALNAQNQRSGGKRGDNGEQEKAASRFIHWQQVYDELHRLYPDSREITIADGLASIPANRFGNTRGVNRYRFDANTGQLTGSTMYNELEDSGKIRGWIYSVHVGSWGGYLTRILWFLAALMGATLPLTGYYLWLKRICHKKSPSKC